MEQDTHSEHRRIIRSISWPLKKAALVEWAAEPKSHSTKLKFLYVLIAGKTGNTSAEEQLRAVQGALEELKLESWDHHCRVKKAKRTETQKEQITYLGLVKEVREQQQRTNAQANKRQLNSSPTPSRAKKKPKTSSALTTTPSFPNSAPVPIATAQHPTIPVSPSLENRGVVEQMGLQSLLTWHSMSASANQPPLIHSPVISPPFWSRPRQQPPARGELMKSLLHQQLLLALFNSSSSSSTPHFSSRKG